VPDAILHTYDIHGPMGIRNQVPKKCLNQQVPRRCQGTVKKYGACLNSLNKTDKKGEQNYYDPKVKEI